MCRAALGLVTALLAKLEYAPKPMGERQMKGSQYFGVREDRGTFVLKGVLSPFDEIS